MLLKIGILCILINTVILGVNGGYRCKARADRTNGCQDYILDCHDDFRIFRSFTTTATCPDNLFFSETYRRCINLATFNFSCPGFGSSGSRSIDSIDSSDSADSMR